MNQISCSVRRRYVPLCLMLLIVGCGEESEKTEVPERTLYMPDAGFITDLEVLSPNDVDAQSSPICDEGSTRPCLNECGRQLCMNRQWSGDCTSVPEQCNDHDDDCDGIADESFFDLGLNTPCTELFNNQCESTGILQCAPSGDSLRCDAPETQPSNEVCDGFDNDCDRSIDEDFPGQTCCTQAYQCPLGHLCQNDECVEPSQDAIEPNMPTACINDTDCSFIEACVNQICRLVCLDDIDCADGYHCECPNGRACPQAICLPNTEQAQCQFDGDCPFQSTCQNGACIGDTEGCLSDAQCSFDQSCDQITNRCENNSEVDPNQCNSGADCTAGYQCDGNGQCVRLPADGPRCVFEQDCPPGYFCERSGRCISLYSNANFCAQAISISDTGSYEGTLSIGSQNLIVPICGYHYIEGVLPAEVSDQVFRWTTPFTGQFTLDTVGSTFDTVIARYNDCTQEARELACNDDFEYPASTDSKLTLSLTQGQIVYLGLSGMDPFASGSFTLNYYAVCTTRSDCDDGQTCIERQCLDDMSSPCQDDAQCPQGSRCQSERCIEDIEQPDACTQDEECPRDQRCLEGACEPEMSEPEGFCDAATPLPLEGLITASTAAGAQLIQPPCAPLSGLPGKDRVFVWTPTESNTYTIQTRGSHPNPVLSIFSGCEFNAQLLNCDDDSGAGLNSEFTLFASAGTAYYIAVSSASDLFDGTFELSVSPVSPLPEDPECTFSNNHECGARAVCLNGRCVQPTETNLCGRAESLIGGSRSGGRCNYPQVIEDELSAPSIIDCIDDGYDGADAHWRWQPCRPGRYQITAQTDAAGVDLSLALYTECNSNRTHQRNCQNASIDGDETIEVDIGPNYFLANDPYGLFQEIVISSRNANSSGNIRLIIDCVEGECVDD